MIAWTREVPSSIASCELTHLERVPIDATKARAQHARYESALTDAGMEVRRLAPLDEHPDAVFVEDTAVVLDELAIITRPGATSRRGELASVTEVLARYRKLGFIREPATIDGGDVLVIEKDIFIGLTPRTNKEGIGQFASMVEPHGYRVHATTVTGCLHLKSAVTRAGPDTLLMNPDWVSQVRLAGWNLVFVDPREASAANVLWTGKVTIMAEEYPGTAERLLRAGDVELVGVPAGELAKAEGGVTCCSLLMRE